MDRKELRSLGRYLLATVFILGVSFAPMALMAHQEEQEIPKVPELDPHFQPQLEQVRPFILWDGYVQVGGGWPQHLMHGRSNELHLRADYRVSLWFKLRTVEDELNPCALNAMEPCEFAVQLVDAHADRGLLDWESTYTFRARERTFELREHFVVKLREIPGDKVLLARLWQRDMELLSYELPVKLHP